MVSILGAGLLVGTALAVIIPEGVHALYEPQQHGEKSGYYNTVTYCNYLEQKGLWCN